MPHQPEAPYVLVPLSKGKFAKVSPEDAPRVLEFKWSATMNAARGREKWYAVRRGQDSGRIYLHRFLTNCPPGMVVDHYPNADGLDCRRGNLRVVSQDVNTTHARFKRGHTGVGGIYL